MTNFEKNINDIEKTQLEEPMLVRGLSIGGIDNQMIVEMVDNMGVKLNAGTRYFLESVDFNTLPKRQKRDMIKIRLNSLGLKGDSLTYDEISKRAIFWGFRECPLETPLELFLGGAESVLDESVFVVTRPIYNSDKIPFIFRVDFEDRSILLTNTSKNEGKGWSENDEFMFLLPRGVVGEVSA